MSEDSAVLNQLVDILGRDELDKQSSPLEDYEFVEREIRIQENPKILRLAMQALEKSVSRSISLAEDGRGFVLLLELLEGSPTISGDRSLRIVCAQTLNKLCRSIAKKHIQPQSIESLRAFVASSVCMGDNIIHRLCNEILEFLSQPKSEELRNDTEQTTATLDVQKTVPIPVEIDPMAIPSDHSSAEWTTETIANWIANLTDKQKSQLKYLVNTVSLTRWMEISGRMRSFYIKDRTNPLAVGKSMRLNERLMDSVHLIVRVGCKPSHFYTLENYNKVLDLATNLANELFYESVKESMNNSDIGTGTSTASGRDVTIQHDHKEDSHSQEETNTETDTAAHVTNAPADASYEANHSHSDDTNDTEAEDLEATPILFSNLADDITLEELQLLMMEYSGCSYITEQDIILPRIARNVVNSRGFSRHAFVHFHCSHDARRAYNGLQGRRFGGGDIKVDFGVGKQCETLYVRGKNVRNIRVHDLVDFFSPICNVPEDKIDIDLDGCIAVVIFPSAALAKVALSRLGSVIRIKNMKFGVGYYAPGLRVENGHLSLNRIHPDIHEKPQQQPPEQSASQETAAVPSNKARSEDRRDDNRKRKEASHDDGTVASSRPRIEPTEDLEATPYLLISHLAEDVTIEELLLVILTYSGCNYVSEQDIIIPAKSVPKDHAGARGFSKHAFVNFRSSSDARRAFDNLQGRRFGGGEIKVEFGVGKQCETLYVRGKNVRNIRVHDLVDFFSPICIVPEDKIDIDLDGCIAVVIFPSAATARNALNRLGSMIRIKDMALGVGYYTPGMRVSHGELLVKSLERRPDEHIRRDGGDSMRKQQGGFDDRIAPADIKRHHRSRSRSPHRVHRESDWDAGRGRVDRRDMHSDSRDGRHGARAGDYPPHDMPSRGPRDDYSHRRDNLGDGYARGGNQYFNGPERHVDSRQDWDRRDNSWNRNNNDMDRSFAGRNDWSGRDTYPPQQYRR